MTYTRRLIIRQDRNMRGMYWQQTIFLIPFSMWHVLNHAVCNYNDEKNHFILVPLYTNT